MVAPALLKEWRRLRALGFRPQQAIDAARVKLEWRAADGIEVYQSDADRDSDGARVRLMYVADLDPSNILDFDCDDSECAYRPNHGSLRSSRERPCKAHAETIRLIDLHGAYGIVGQYFDPRVASPRAPKWIDVDSCFGFIGNDLTDNGYDADIMRATLEAARHNNGC